MLENTPVPTRLQQNRGLEAFRSQRERSPQEFPSGLVLHDVRQSLLCIGCPPVSPHLIMREAVTVMDVEEVAGHGRSGI
jgi:hypothetical protein